MNFSEKLQKLRKSGGYSQEELANELSVSRQAISKWEQGTVPDINNLLAISKFFDCSLDYLLNDAFEERAEKRDEVETIKLHHVDISLVLSVAGLALPVLSFLTIYMMSLVANVRFSVGIIGERTRHYMGICAFIEKYGLSSLVIFQSAVFVVAYLNLCYRNYCRRKLMGKTRISFFLGVIMIVALVCASVFSLVTSSSIFLEPFICIVIIVYTICAILLTFYKFGGKTK